MNSIFFLPLILLALASCKEEEVEAYNDLTDAEKQMINEMGQTQCLSRVAEAYEVFKAKTYSAMMGSSFNRGDGFEFQFKNGTSVTKTVEIKVWKQTASELFFYITDNDASSDYFLRIQKTDNEQMIEDMKAAHCSRPVFYKSVAINSSSLTVSDEYELPRAPNTEVYADSYVFSFSYPAFFANYGLTRTKTIEDVDDNLVGSAENFTSTLTAKTYTFNDTNAENSNEYTQKFCVINRGAAYRLARERNVIGFKINLDSTTDCPTTKPADWNMTI